MGHNPGSKPPPPPAGLALTVDAEAIRGLVEQVVDLALARIEAARAALPDTPLAYTEARAAGLIGLQRHQLRDLRLRGEITASRIVGRRIVYLRSDLVDYLMRNRTGSEQE
jgi:hypothetical protein